MNYTFALQKSNIIFNFIELIQYFFYFLYIVDMDVYGTIIINKFNLEFNIITEYLIILLIIYETCNSCAINQKYAKMQFVGCISSYLCKNIEIKNLIQE